ncbi:type VI secretion system tube protein Hcp [Cronobacter sakazakii]|uniref:Hcp family type VI secretion system effector n=1 Tax=Cronobacter sakazakii TaxID=28141 RepID=UPI000CF0FACC|nr:type VI secretion system tube protein TssD [Cronobacter sakazakii]EIX1503698.1 type VI secretion system tube protein Hcp [Cronobacter sakazakii]EIX1525900.1 type VI secretion system tube protein Hcp [Cronobacter sakazakii]EIX1534280.1 type VI secretion system tube protein Hcp [Cronobacter sakazakii]EIX1622316.1 type VI secretion system tube protein Hcp [Cronobacter sakazakii]EIX1663530.1 type VI secretion system tube protein Hcp [Cronobacter sakazakii]
MAVPAHLWLYDASGALICGGSEVMGREGSIEVQSFGHGLSVPFNGNTGKLTATRVHNLMNIEKEFDKSSPYLYRAVAASEKLQRAIIRWYRINHAGMEEEFFQMILEDVRITGVHPNMQNFKHPEGLLSTPVESVGLIYNKITWKYLNGNIQYTDAWNSQMYV